MSDATLDDLPVGHPAWDLLVGDTPVWASSFDRAAPGRGGG